MFSTNYFPLLQPHQIKSEDGRSETSSPIIRVCDSPASSVVSPRPSLPSSSPRSMMSSSFSSLASPPRTPTDVLEAASEVVRPPASQPAKNLSFSIDNILRTKMQQQAPSSISTIKPAIVSKPVPVSVAPKPKPAAKIDVEVPPMLARRLDHNESALNCIKTHK